MLAGEQAGYAAADGKQQAHRQGAWMEFADGPCRGEGDGGVATGEGEVSGVDAFGGPGDPVVQLFRIRDSGAGPTSKKLDSFGQQASENNARGQKRAAGPSERATAEVNVGNVAVAARTVNEDERHSYGEPRGRIAHDS